MENTKDKLVKGLTSNPKYLPHWYNYDNVGSEIQYRTVTEPLAYYSTRSEMSILKHSVQDFIPQVPHDLTLVDLGSGNCFKIRLVIDELLRRQKNLTFYPVDISESFLMKSAKALSEEYDCSLVVRPVAADYVTGIEQLKRVDGFKLITWFCGILNLPYNEQVDILRMISTVMTDKCVFVFSADVTQDKEAIIQAYHDKEGLVQAFNQHAIAKLNEEEGSRINLDMFTYNVDFISDSNPQYMSYTRAYLQSKEDICYSIPGLGIDLVMEKGEHLYFHEGDGFSCKYNMEQLQNIVKKAGLCLADSWLDEEKHVVFLQCTTV
ncbi:histidine N-alpha-methyltransferase-like [Pecten maximus]|uniref:histidine N-alpha-methyltransferase-like n=1 Tax=Pecten maximus TaxID=6579 RepID=UPI001458766F|nr:histidine N-alpha-methyltransferase-like [Pecten maximus]